VANPRVVVLGAGFGGLSFVHAMRESGVDCDVLVVDRSPSFRMGLRHLWVLDGRAGAQDGARPRAVLGELGIPFRQGEIEAIDLDNRAVRVDGDAVAWDYLVVGLGAEARPDLVPGGDTNPSLYDYDGARAAGARLTEIERGRIVVAIAGLPYKCPPAPYEAALLMNSYLRRRGRRDDVEILAVSPQPSTIPAAGQVACNSVEDQLAEHGIDFRPNTKVERLEPGRVVAGGETLDADLVLTVPPHRPPAVVKASGLTGDGEWVKVDPLTLATGVDGVFAIGDVVEMKTGAGMPFPKAGVFAEAHGAVVARNLAAHISGRDADARFDGVGQCFLEVGDGAASMVRGNFLSSPPDVTIAAPDPENLVAKERFEAERLDRWLPLR